jgi:hypothetical protein
MNKKLSTIAKIHSKKVKGKKGGKERYGGEEGEGDRGTERQVRGGVRLGKEQ